MLCKWKSVVILLMVIDNGNWGVSQNVILTWRNRAYFFFKNFLQFGSIRLTPCGRRVVVNMWEQSFVHIQKYISWYFLMFIRSSKALVSENLFEIHIVVTESCSNVSKHVVKALTRKQICFICNQFLLFPTFHATHWI